MWKYQLYPGNENHIRMPTGARILSVQVQKQVGPCVWVEVDPDAFLVTRVLRIVGTGFLFDPDSEHLSYIGTFQMDEPGFVTVWHLYDAGELI